MKVFGIEAKAKRIVSQLAEVPIGSQKISMPLFIIDGAKDGPTLCITAGVHGCEYASIEAAYRLRRILNPEEISGAVIILPVCNMPSFQKRSVYTTPVDNKNLNRSFPGSKQGSFSDVLAHQIFENAISKADVYVDLHGGDLAEALVPFVTYPNSGNPEVTEKSRAIAETFGALLVVSEIAGSSIYAASKAGIPAIMAEAGGQGLWPEESVDIHLSGMRAVMGQIGLLDRKPAKRLSAKEVSFPWIHSDHDGLFYPKVSIGEKISQGQQIGSICDYCGEKLQSVASPADGTVLFLVTSLAINKGDPLLGLGSS